jgi:hypothetical protein
VAGKRTRIKANSGGQQKRKKPVDTMPPGMREAMMGSTTPPQQKTGPQLPPNSAAMDWFETLRDTDDPDKLYSYPYEHPEDPTKNRIVYFKRETALERNAYIMDFAENRLTIGALKCVFLRLRDEKGERVFTNQDQYEWLLKNAAGSSLEEIGTAIFGFDREGETDLETEKNDSGEAET